MEDAGEEGEVRGWERGKEGGGGRGWGVGGKEEGEVRGSELGREG